MENTACCVCCKPNDPITCKESTRLSMRPESGTTINPYACSEIVPMNGTATYENEYKEPTNVYVNTRDRPARYSVKIPSAIYDDVDGQVRNTYETHILTNYPGTSEVQNRAMNEISVEDTKPKTKESQAKTNRKKSDDDGYDSNSQSSIALQEGETLLVENDLYDSK